jgi:hypothetical protein
MDNGNEMRDFLVSRRARITPEQAGLPAYGGNRRVAGLRREEVALAGVSIDYYIRLERGRAHGASGFYPGWERQAQDVVAMLRTEAGRSPYDKALSSLIGELSTRSENFRTWWAVTLDEGAGR